MELPSTAITVVTPTATYVTTPQLHHVTSRTPHCQQRLQNDPETMTVITPLAMYSCTPNMSVISRQEPDNEQDGNNTPHTALTDTVALPNQGNPCNNTPMENELCSEGHYSTVAMVTPLATYIATPRLRFISRQPHAGENTDCSQYQWPQAQMEVGPCTPDKLVV